MRVVTESMKEKKKKWPKGSVIKINQDLGNRGVSGEGGQHFSAQLGRHVVFGDCPH